MRQTTQFIKLDTDAPAVLCGTVRPGASQPRTARAAAGVALRPLTRMVSRRCCIVTLTFGGYRSAVLRPGPQSGCFWWDTLSRAVPSRPVTGRSGRDRCVPLSRDVNFICWFKVGSARRLPVKAAVGPLWFVIGRGHRCLRLSVASYY